MSFIKICSILLTFFSLLGCHAENQSADIVVGTIAGPETELVEVAKQIAKEQYDLEVKIIEFSDYNLPNEALSDGSLDMNIYQHLPFLQASMEARGYSLSVIGKTFIYPMGIYSNRYKNIQDLPESALIAVPNDPSNQTRALLLLQSAGLISLKPKNMVNLHDILSNPKHLKIKELDAAQLPRMLQDVDASVINTNFAIPAGLSPSQDALFLESKDSPYANIMVVRTQDLDKPRLNQFVMAMHSQAVIQKAKELFGENAIAAWE
jgi:D-methionine transport system substrate-binding protein